jgi:hypothetical protein
MATYTLDWSDTNLGGSAVVSYLRGALVDFVDKPAGATAALSCTPNLGAGDHVIAEFEIETSGSSVMTFDYHTSSETNWDKLHFDVDGVSQANFHGEIAWTSHPGISIPSAGTHTIRIRFNKDAGAGGTADRVWVANLNITNTVTVNDDTGGSVDIYDMESGSIPSFITTSTWINSTSEPIAGSRSLRSPLTTSGNGSYDMTITKGVNSRYRVLAFDWKVSSEAGWDKLFLFPDASGSNIPAHPTAPSEGLPGWLQYSGTASGHSAFILPPEASSVLVRYAKDAGGNSGSDAAWIDTIEMPVYNAALNGAWQLEDGTGNWLLEDGSGYWVTEDYEAPAGSTVDAAASLTATSTLTVAAPSVLKPAAASLTATSTLTTAAPTTTKAAAVALVSTSTLTTAAPMRTQAAATSLVSASTLTTASPVLVRPAAVSLTAASTLTSAAVVSATVTAAASLTSTSTFTVASPTLIRPVAVSFAAASTLTAAAFTVVATTVSLAAVSTLTTGAFRNQFVAASLVGTSTLTVGAPTQTCFATVSLGATSVLTAGAFRNQPVAVLLTTESDLTASAEGDAAAEAALVAVSTLQVGAPLRTRPGAVSLASSSALTAAATRIIPVAVSLSSTGTLTISGVRILPAATSLTATSTLLVSALGGGAAATSLTAASTLTVGALRIRPAEVSLTGTSGLTVAAPSRAVPAAVSLSAEGALMVTSSRETFGAVVLSATSTLAALGVVPARDDISNSTFAVLRRNPSYATMRPNFSWARMRDNETL